MTKGRNPFVSEIPNLLADWHPTKNGDMSPYTITSGSGKKVWWKCHKCGHEWEASISNRAKGRGCSYCSKKICIEGVNDFKTINPKAAAEWDYEKNHPITPNTVMAHSNKIYWFKCEKNHSWQASPSNRKKNGCPYCGNQKLLKGYNDLASKNPALCEEWDFEKNAPLAPDDVMQFSNTTVWWKCRTCGHQWEAKVNNRSNGTGCPNCKADYKVSEAERIIFYYIHQHFSDAKLSYRPKWLNKKEIDIYIPSLSLGIEYDGEAWHRDPIKDITKSTCIIENGISLIRLRETGCPAISDGSHHIYVSTKNYKYSRLNQPILEIFNYINEHYNLSISCDINAERDYQNILSLSSATKAERSLLAVNPQLCKDWDYTKNKLLPHNILPVSNKIVWWKCHKCGYEWKASVCNRNRGNSCPLCSNKVVIAGVNDLLTTNPDIAAEWDYSKNGSKTPQTITFGHSKKVWWKCHKCGYEWQTSVANRMHNGCPKCAIARRADSNMRNRVILGKNDLSSQYPEIAKEWHPLKNGTITPETITINSNKTVWWICNKGHEWESAVAYRTKNHSNCPYCEGKLVLEGYNDIATLFPQLCDEWNYEKNAPLTPQTIPANYNKKLWWKCPDCNNEWQATLRTRLDGKSCGKCAAKTKRLVQHAAFLKSKGSFFDANPEAAKDWDYDKNYPLKPTDVTPNAGDRIWWKCHVCGYEWQTTVNHVNHGTGCRQCKQKNNYAKHRKKVINLDTGMIFESITSAAKYYNIDVSSVSMCCSGKTKTAHGFRWSYIID